MIQAAKIIVIGVEYSGYVANKKSRIQSNKFSTSLNKSHPARILEQAKSKFSISTPSDPDIDPARFKSPVFENDKLNVSENIHKELKESNFPKDSKVVDQIVEKHLKIRDSHLAAYEDELREDCRLEILEIKKSRLTGTGDMEKEADYKASLLKDSQIDRYIRHKNEDLKKELSEHYRCCEEENKLVKLSAAHYKKDYCDPSEDAEGSAKGQSPLDYVLEKQKTEMADITDLDGGGD